MQPRTYRHRIGLAVAVLLTVGTACGTRLEKDAIVAAHDGTGSLALGPAGATPSGPGAGASADAPSDTAAAGSTAVDAGSVGSATATGATSSGVGTATASQSRPGGTGVASPGNPASANPATRAGGAVGPAATPTAAGGTSAAAAPQGGGAPAANPGPASGAPIVIGSVGTSSGIVGAAVGPGLPAVRAWVASINATGGLNGHPIKHVVGDDGGDPARHRQLVQQMVEKDHVAAFVFNFAPLSGQASIDYLNQKRVPVIGDSGAAQWYYQSPMFFPQFSTGAVWVRAMIAAAARETIPQGKKKLAILNCQEAQFCVDADKMWPEEAPKVGYELVFRRQASLAQPDYTAECLAARNAGAEVFGLAMDGNAIGRIASSCARSGFHPIYFIHHSALLVDHAKDPNLDGIVVPLASRAWFDTSNPVVVRYQKALSTYVPGEKFQDNSFAGWVAAEMFQLAATKAPDPTTPAGILEGLWSLNGETLGDITHPLKFNRDQNATEVKCWFVIQGSQGKWANTELGKSLSCPQ